MEDPPPDALCERCWQTITKGQRYARLAQAVGTQLGGEDITWAYTYLHHYDREDGCVTDD